MVSDRGSTPSPRETFMQMAQASGLRSRVFLTLGLLLLCRVGIYIPIPNIDRTALEAVIGSNAALGFLNLFSGGGFATLGIFTLGILPFINASIIMQLLATAIPSLERLQKEEGEQGRRQVSQYTRYLTLVFAMLQGLSLAIWALSQQLTTAAASTSPVAFVFTSTLALAAGSAFVMWVGELITERGVGNGPSLLIFINIVSSLPTALINTISQARTNDSYVGGTILLFVVFIVMIVGIVCVQEGQRRIPIISAKRQVGNRLYREQKSYLPLKLNQGGVMPIIFATSVLILPSFLVSTFATENQLLIDFFQLFTPNSWTYILFYLILILFFSYFYASILINPEDLAKNLKKMGTSIPGIRPGKATADYISQVMNRLTFLGAIFLGAVATIPSIVETATGIRTFQGLGATSLLILVGVAIDTSKQIQTYVVSQRYEGMVKQ